MGSSDQKAAEVTNISCFSSVSWVICSRRRPNFNTLNKVFVKIIISVSIFIFMNRKGLLNTGCLVILLLSFALFTAILAGCATQGFKPRNMAGVSRYFNADRNTVWNAIIQSAEGIPVEINDREKGVLRTQWVKGWSANKTTGLLLEGHWQERYRLLIKVSEEQSRTYVSISAQVETKALVAARRTDGPRIPSDGAIDGFGGYGEKGFFFLYKF